jgi:hypothetical protein
MPISRSPVFIVGCQRSGTTLLRLLLNAHPRIAIPEEGGFWIPLIRRFRNNVHWKIKEAELEKYLRYIENNSQFKLWGMDPQKSFEEIRRQRICTLAGFMTAFYSCYVNAYEKDIWGDKTPSFFRMIPVLARLFPGARFIHIVRDGRDIYLSWQKMNVHKRNISTAAIEWVHKVRKAKKGLDQLTQDRYMEIRYEDLVAEQGIILRQICDFLGLEYEASMLKFWQTSDQFIGSHHSELIFKPVSSKSVGKWKRELSKREITKFESIAGATLVSLGYKLSQGNTLAQRLPIGAVFELAYGLPLRIGEVFCTALSLNVASKFGLRTDTTGMRISPEKTHKYPAAH